MPGKSSSTSERKVKIKLSRKSPNRYFSPSNKKSCKKIWKFKENFLSLRHDYARGDVHPMTEDPLVQDYGCARPSSFFNNFKCNIMDTKSSLPSVKIAVLIDGGFFIKRFNYMYNKERIMTGAEVAGHLYTLAHKHVGVGNVLYRIFYYDCIPFGRKMRRITNNIE